MVCQHLGTDANEIMYIDPKQVATFFSNAKLLVIPQAGHIALCDKPLEAPEMASCSDVFKKFVC